MCVGDALGVGHEQQNHCVRDGSYLLAVKGLELERRQGLDVALYTYSLVCALHPAVGRARNHKLDARARAHTHTHTHTCTCTCTCSLHNNIVHATWIHVGTPVLHMHILHEYIDAYMCANNVRVRTCECDKHGLRVRA